MPSSTDPLLPYYDPAPEISNTGSKLTHSDEISYGSTQLYKSAAVESYETTDQLETNAIHEQKAAANDESTATMETGMANFFRTVCALIFFIVVAAMFASALRSHDGLSSPWPSAPREGSIQQRAQRILDTTPLIDGHNDLAIFIRGKYKNNLYDEKFKHDFEQGGMPENVDLPRLRNGSVGGAFWSAFVACPANASFDLSDENYATAAAHTLQQIDLLRRLQDQYAQDFTKSMSGSAGRDHMLSEWRQRKSFFGPISIEGLHQVVPSSPMSSLRSYYDLGVRMATLTWNCHNAFADAALISNDFTTPPQVVNGISRPDEGAVTKRGRAVIREMNRLGMIVDISHTSYWTQKAILEGISQAPVVFSHSSAYSLCPHPRNVRDDVLDLVPKSKSLVMVNFSPAFISCTPHDQRGDNTSQKHQPHFSLPVFYEQNNTLHQVARHIQYIGSRIGYDYVGLGSDFDGMGEKTPRGLEGVDKFRDLVEELLRLGIGDEDVRKITGENILRVWADVDALSDKLRKDGLPPGLDSE